MFTGTVGRIRMDVDVRTSGALAQVAVLKKAIEGMSDGRRGDLKNLFVLPQKSFAQLGQEANQTGLQINNLVMKAYVVQAAISSLVPVIAQLVGGLFAVGSQAAAAGPALVVLPGILSAIMQAGITAKLALGGVFKAVGELGKQKTGVDQLPSKIAAVSNAQWQLERSTKALEKAYRDANERIEQLAFSIEDAAIAQSRAALTLKDARETLARVQDLPPNSRARQEAELAFKEADLNYRRAIDTAEDLADEQKRVTKDGTLNAEQQVEQSDEVVNAIHEQKKAVEALAKAQADLRKGSGGLTEFNKLSGAAKEFARYLAGLKPEIQKLKDAAGEELFAPLQASIKNLVDNLFPRLQPLLRATGKALGQTALDFSKTVTEAKNLASFEKIGKTNVYVTERFGKVLGNLYTVVVQVLDAAGPLIKRFTDWVVVLTGGYDATSKTANETGKLGRVFKYAGDVAAQLGDIIGNLIGGLFNMGKAASGPGSGGEMIFEAMEKSTKKFKDFTKKISEDGSLEDYFKQSATGFLQVFGILGKIIKIVLKSATQPGTKEFLDSISRAVDYLGVGFESLSGTAPAFGKFIEEFARMTVTFTESGSIVAFFETLTKAVQFVAKIMENELVAKVFHVLAVMHGAKLAVLAVKMVLVKLGMYLVYLVQVALKPVTFLFRYLTGTLMMSSAAAAGLMAAIAAVIIVLVIAYKKSEKFRKSLADLVKTVFAALKKAAIEIKEAFDDAFGSILKKGTTAQTIFKGIGDALAKYVVPIYKYMVPRIIDVFKQLIIAIIKIVAGIIQVFYGLFQAIGGLIKIFKGDFSEGFGGIKDGVVSMLKGLWKIIVGFFQSIPALIKMAMGNLLGPVGFAIYEAIAGAFKAVGRAIAFTWNKVIRPVFEAIGTVISFVWSKILKPVFGLIAKAFGAISGPAATGIGKVFSLIGSALGKIGGAGLKGLSVAFTAIAGAAGVLWKVLKPVLGVLLKIGKAIGIVLYVAGLIVFTTIGILIAETWRKLKKLGVAIWQNLIYPFAKHLKPSILKAIYVVNLLLRPFKMVFKGIWLVVKVFIGLFYYAFLGLKALFKFVFSDTMRKIVLVAFLFVLSKLNKLKRGFFTVLHAIGGVFGKVFGVIGKIVSVAFDIMKKVFKEYWETLKYGLNKLWVIAGKVFDGISWLFSKAWNVISVVFDFVWDKIKEAIPKLWDAAKWVFGKVRDGFKNAWDAIQWIFDNVWPKIWGGIQWAWDNVIKPVFRKIREVFTEIWNVIKSVFDAIWPKISEAIGWAWENVIKPAFEKMGEVFGKIWNGIKAVFDFVWPLIRWGIEWAWNTIIKPIFDAMGEVFGKIWNGIKAAFDFVWPYIQIAIQWAWDNVIKPVFDKMGEIFDKIWNGIKAVFDPIWNGITGAIGWAWDNVIKPTADKIGEIFGKIWGGIKTKFHEVWDGIKLMFTDFPQFLKNVWNNALDFVDGFLEKIINGFKQIPELIGKVFGGIVDIIRGAINLVIKGFNSTLGGKSFKIPGTDKKFGFDKIPELGSGEKTTFEQVVTGGYRKLPKLALGGTVLPSPGGTLVNVAEAGRAERIEPLDKNGLSKRDKAMIAMLAGGGTGGITINVHPSPGMNEVELAALVNRQLAFELRKGAA